MLPLHTKDSYEIRFTPTARTCATIGRDVRLWDLETGQVRWRAHPFSHPSYVAFAPDGSRLAIKNTAGRIILLDPSGGEVINDFANQHEGEGSNPLFSSCGQYLVDGSWDGLFTIRGVASGEIAFRKRFEGEMIPRVHVCRAGQMWITEHHPKATAPNRPPADGYFLRWAWPIGRTLPERLPLAFPFLRSAAFGPRGDLLAVHFGAPPRNLVVYHLPAQRLLWSANVNVGGSGGALRWSPEGAFLGFATGERVAVYRGTTGALAAAYPLPYACDVAFSPDGRLIGCGSWESGRVQPFVPEDGGGI